MGPRAPAAVRAAARGEAAGWAATQSYGAQVDPGGIIETRQGRTHRFASIRWRTLPSTRDSSYPYVAEFGQIPPHTDWTNGKKQTKN